MNGYSTVSKARLTQMQKSNIEKRKRHAVACSNFVFDAVIAGVRVCRTCGFPMMEHGDDGITGMAATLMKGHGIGRGARKLI